MSPDSPAPSTARRAWRFMSAFGCVLAAASILLNVALFSEIQESRRQSVLTSCREQNLRHDATVRALDRVLAAPLRAAASPGRRSRLERSRAATVVLIDQLAPERDCERLARELTGTS